MGELITKIKKLHSFPIFKSGSVSFLIDDSPKESYRISFNNIGSYSILSINIKVSGSLLNFFYELDTQSDFLVIPNVDLSNFVDDENKKLISVQIYDTHNSAFSFIKSEIEKSIDSKKEKENFFSLIGTPPSNIFDKLKIEKFKCLKEYNEEELRKIELSSD